MAGAPARIVQLVETFSANIDAYKNQQYNETQARREFIDPFFEALGWDVTNKSGYAQAYKDVIHEDAIKVGSATKAPDYSFRIGGQRKFFLEAKKPAVSIKDDISPAYQLRRYAWSANLPLSILTDFEEFAVYDCRTRPKQSDSAANGRIMYLTYKDFIERWNEIESIFSKEAVLKGSFDKFTLETKGKRGTGTVDIEFLNDIEDWRKKLAQTIAHNNRSLTKDEINFAVQRTIDRILFMRICEDMGIEPYKQLHSLINGPRVYPRLCELFQIADEKYNSGLFHFKPESDRPETPDELTLNLTIEDSYLKLIFDGLYYPKSPYEFSVIPAEILGNVYEQFLGMVISVSSSRRVDIQPKPEVKKAGGVYYTPSYIVDYIVKNTVGKLCENKPPKEIAKLRFLDPACGSGSFLLGAYTYLLDYHCDWYIANNLEKHTKQIYQGKGGLWRLTIDEKKKILLNNIFGVDIDSQAVEVTKLSLLLKVLEGESMETVKSTHRRALPDLGNNIKCGNSLIAPDFFENPDIDSSDAELQKKINPFDWKKEFPLVFKQGGFDAIIGNPPYVLLQTLNDPHVFNYLAKNFQVAMYKIDTYHLFLEVGAKLTRYGGFEGFITPNTFLRNQHARELRHMLLTSSEIQELLLFDYNVFRGASVDTSIIICRRSQKPSNKNFIAVLHAASPSTISNPHYIEQESWSSQSHEEFNIAIKNGVRKIIEKINAVSFELKTIATAYFGIQTFGRDKFVSDRKKLSIHQPVIDGANIDRYALLPSKEFVVFRPNAIKSGGKQFVYSQERIGVRQIGKTPIATILPAGIFTLNTIYNIFFTAKTDCNLRFILGIISSRVTQFYWQMLFFDQKKTFPKIKKPDLLSIRIPKINFAVPADKAKHDKMVKLVETMLDLNKKLAAAKIPDQKTKLQRQIDSTDSQIDRLVYDLYDLTDDEIKIIEG